MKHSDPIYIIALMTIGALFFGALVRMENKYEAENKALNNIISGMQINIETLSGCNARADAYSGMIQEISIKAQECKQDIVTFQEQQRRTDLWDNVPKGLVRWLGNNKILSGYITFIEPDGDNRLWAEDVAQYNDPETYGPQYMLTTGDIFNTKEELIQHLSNQ